MRTKHLLVAALCALGAGVTATPAVADEFTDSVGTPLGVGATFAAATPGTSTLDLYLPGPTLANVCGGVTMSGVTTGTLTADVTSSSFPACVPNSVTGDHTVPWELELFEPAESTDVYSAEVANVAVILSPSAGVFLPLSGTLGDVHPSNTLHWHNAGSAGAAACTGEGPGGEDLSAVVLDMTGELDGPVGTPYQDAMVDGTLCVQVVGAADPVVVVQ